MYAKKIIAIKILVSYFAFTALCNQENLNSLRSLNAAIDILKSNSATKGLRKEFFEKMMGFDEVDRLIRPFKNKDLNYNQIFLSKNLLEKKQIDGRPQFVLHDFSGINEYQAGFFTMSTIMDLKKQANNLVNTNDGKFNIVIGTKTDLNSSHRNTVDIGALQADPKNKNAVFQVASNFSALEPTSKTHYPESGISEYIHDYTQGPFASISAAPGLFYRMYGIFYDSLKEPAMWRQTKNHQIELLDGGVQYPRLKKIFPVINGYVDYANNIDSLDLSFIEKDKEEIRIGYHRDIQVLYGFTDGENHYELDDKTQIINQVFTAAIDFGSLNADYKNNPEVVKRAKALLNAAYEGTLLAAATNNKNKVFLSLIGGGVFQNDISWIVDAIVNNRAFIKDKGLNVTLVIYDYSGLKKFNFEKDLNYFKDAMVDLVEFTSGKVVIDGQVKDADDIKNL